jgi:hypothetical protein
MTSTAQKFNVDHPKCTEEMKRFALEEVLNSSTFERADLLKKFLRYVCEMEIAGRFAEINEYTIGIEALGRPATYSPGEDSSVRSRAYAVREKLAAFYESERVESPIRIEFRKGSYVPHFVPRSEPERRMERTSLYKINQNSPSTSTAVKGFAAGAATAALLAVFALAFLRPGVEIQPVASVLREFWGPLLQPGGDVILCLATAPSMLLHSYKDNTVPPGPRIFQAPDEVAKWYAGLHMQDGGGPLYSQTSVNTTLFGDNLAAIAAVKITTAAGNSVQVLPEYSLNSFALRGRNVLVIGSPNYSPFAAQILQKSPFSVRYDPVTKLEVISADPSSQEPAIAYSAERDQESMGLKRAYGLITVLPSPGDHSHRIILFSGISSAGTQAAVEFFSSPASLRNLKLRMGRTPPPSYQVVIRCGVVNNLALDWTYETHRILEKPPLIN